MPSVAFPFTKHVPNELHNRIQQAKTVSWWWEDSWIHRILLLCTHKEQRESEFVFTALFILPMLLCTLTCLPGCAVKTHRAGGGSRVL